jgi:hypothetical protein
VLAGFLSDSLTAEKQVTLKRTISLPVIFIAIGYLIAFLDKAFVFVLFFPVVVISGIILVWFIIFLTIKTAGCNMSIRKTPPDYRRRKSANIAIGIVSLIISVALPLTIFRTPKQTGKGADRSNLHALKSLPYVSWAPAEDAMDKIGVTKYNADKTFDGINILASVGTSKVSLIDMQGQALHKWAASGTGEKWSDNVEFRPNGDLLLIDDSKRLIRLDWNSNVKWVNTDFRYHHEITPAENGDLYVLGMKDKMIFIAGLPLPILNDYIVVVSPDGKTKSSISLLRALRSGFGFDTVCAAYRWIITPKHFRKVLKRRYVGAHGTSLDVFHNNTITIMERTIEGVCQKNALLICVRDMDLIGAFDVVTADLVWSWGPGQLDRPHHPTLLENDNILIFDNGKIRGYSRIIELDPKAKTIAWEYKATPPEAFFSEDRSSAQRLPNGNTLITESRKGRVFEITSDGEIVWEFYNPDIDEENETRSTIYRMMRITDSANYPALSQIKKHIPEPE